MTTLSWVPRINVTKTVTVIPTISTSAYTAGFQLGGIMTLTDVVRQDPQGLLQGTSEIHSITILDGAKQDAPIDIWFFNQSPTLTSSNGNAFAITAANLQAQCIGAVSIGTSYSDAAAVSTSSDGKNLGLVLSVPSAGTGLVSSTNIYAVAIVRGTPTYTSTTALKFLFSFYVD